MPVYPALGRQVRVSGTVRLMGIIAKDGHIRELKLLSGHPMLSPAALDAVRQWIYSPTTLNGEPVEVEAPIDVIFELR
jgi:protein TonB